jgi:hypothetical protein
VPENPVNKRCVYFEFGKLDPLGNELPPQQWRPLCSAPIAGQEALCPHADPALHLAEHGFQEGPASFRNTFGLCPLNPAQQEGLDWLADHPEFGK